MKEHYIQPFEGENTVSLDHIQRQELSQLMQELDAITTDVSKYTVFLARRRQLMPHIMTDDLASLN